MKFLSLVLMCSVWLFCLGQPAHAGFVVAFFVSIGFGAATATAIAGFLINTVISIALSALARAFAKGKDTGGGISRKQTMSGSDTSQSVIVGLYGTAGSWIAPRMSHGANNNYLTYVIALSDMPGCELNRIFVNGNEVYVSPYELSPEGYGAKLVNTIEQVLPDPGEPDPNPDPEPYPPVPNPADEWRLNSRNYLLSNMFGSGNRAISGTAWVKYYNGSQVAADPMLMAKYGGNTLRPWKSTMIGRNMCYAIVTFYFDRNTYTDMPDVMFELRGIPMYDFRKDSSVGGSGPQRWADKSTWTSTPNPVVIIYNILRGITLPDGRVWGGECEAEDLPLALWSVEANKCDEKYEYETGKWATRYRCGLEVEFDKDEPLDIIDELKKVCCADLIEFGGVYKIRVGGPGLPVAFINDADLMRNVRQEFAPFPGLSKTYNAVAAVYPDPYNNWRTNDAPVHRREDFVVEDEGRRLQAQVTLSACPFIEQVQTLQQTWLLDNRKWRTHNLHVGHTFCQVEVLDCIAWTSPRNGYINKQFDVQQNVQVLANLQQMFEVREVDPTDYDFDVSAILPTVIGNPFPEKINAAYLSTFSVSQYVGRDSANEEFVSGFSFSWNPSTESWASRIIVEVTHGTTGQKLPAVVIENIEAGTHIYTTGIIPNQPYAVRARPVVDRPWAWTVSSSVLSPNVYMPAGSLSPDVWEEIETIAGEMGIPSVTTLPASGDRPNQIVLKMPEAVLYRWDAGSSTWTTALYAGIKPGAVGFTELASNMEAFLIWTGALPTTRQTSDLLFRTNDSKMYRWNGTAYTATVPTLDLTGQIVNAQIGNAAVTASKLLIGKTDNLFLDGEVQDAAYWNSSGAMFEVRINSGFIPPNGINSKGAAFYTHALNGGLSYVAIGQAAAEYIPVTPGEEYWFSFQERRISGTVSTSHVRAMWYDNTGANIGNVLLKNSQASTTNTSWVPSTAIAVVPANAVKMQLRWDVNGGAGLTDGNMIFGSPVIRKRNGGELIVDGSISTNHLISGSVTTAILAADSVTAGKIAAAAVTAREVAANAITATKMALMDTENLVRNGSFITDDAIMSVFSYVNTGSLTYSTAAVDTGARSVAHVKDSLSVQSPAAFTPFAVLVNEQFYWEVAWRNIPGSGETSAGGVYLQAVWLNAAGAGILTQNVLSNGSITAAFQTASGKVTAPAGAVSVLFRFMNFTNSTALGILWDRLIVRRANAAQLIVDGGITANHMSVGSITANAMAVNAVTASAIAAGAVTAVKISVANLAAINANLGAITAGSLNINNLFIVAANGQTTIRSAATGARLVFESARIAVYDESNVLRIEIGQLT